MMLGNNIKNIRKSKNITIKQISELTGLTSSYLSMLENNKRENPSIETLNKIADALKVFVDDFFKDDVEVEKNSNNSNDRSIKNNLPIIPEEFINADEARAYVDKHQIFGSEGFDPERLDDEEILEFANALLEQMKMVSYKFKK